METEDDLGIRVWVGNLGKYVEGELKGGWASLPMPQQELNRFLRDTVGLGPEAAEARATGRVYEEYAIHDYEYDGLLEALDYRPDEYENLDDLNLLARAAQVFERESPGMIERVRMAADTLVQSTPLSLANLIAQCDDIDWCEYDPPAGIDPANIDDLDELYAWHCVERDPDLARVMQGRWGMYMDMAWPGRDSALCDDVTLGEHGFLLANGVPDANRYDRGELRELLDALDPPAPAPDFRLENLLEEGEHIERYAIEDTGTNWGAPDYGCIMPYGSTDLAAGLEDTVQRIIADRGRRARDRSGRRGRHRADRPRLRAARAHRHGRPSPAARQGQGQGRGSGRHTPTRQPTKRYEGNGGRDEDQRRPCALKKRSPPCRSGCAAP